MPDLTKDASRVQQQTTSTDKSAVMREALRAAADAAPVAAQARTAELGQLFDQLSRLAATQGPDGPALRADQPTALIQDQVDDLGKTQQRQTLRTMEAGKQIQRTLATALDRLDRRQGQQLKDAADQPQPVVDALVLHHNKQRDDLAALVEHANTAMERNTQELRNRQQMGIQRVGAALAGPDRAAALSQEATRVNQDAQGLQRSQRQLLGHVKRASQSIVTRPTPEQMRGLRQRTGVTADQLDDAAMQRVADSARGRKAGDALNAIKGQLAEEFNNKRAEADVRKADDPDLRFIAGHRLRDGLGRQLTDGIVIRRQQDGLHRVEKAFEVKAGEPGARDLLSKLDRDTSAQLLRVARDLARDELALGKDKAAEPGVPRPLRHSPGITRAAFDETVERHLRELQKPAAQRESGQLSLTIERLDQQRLFVDGVELAQVADQERRRVDVVAVLAADTQYTEQAQRLDQDEAHVQAVAEAIANATARWPRP